MGSEEYDAALEQTDEAREVFQEAASPAVVLALLAEREALRAALGEMVTTFYDAGCHICGGDCASANPPVGGCPVRVIERARAALSGSAAP